MPKDYTASKVEDLRLSIKFSTPTDPIKKEENGIFEYYAAVQKISCVGKNGLMEVRVPPIVKYYGNSKTVPWTAKEVGDAMKNFSNFNTVLYDDIKQLYIDTLNEDIS